MARGTPKSAKKQAAEGTVFPSGAVARNVRGYRLLRRMDQTELGRRMSLLDQEWSGGIVGSVERGDRTVNIDELWALGLCLGVPIGKILDPTGLDNRTREGIDLGAAVISPKRAHRLAIGVAVAEFAPDVVLRRQPGHGAPKAPAESVVVYQREQPRYDDDIAKADPLDPRTTWPPSAFPDELLDVAGALSLANQVEHRREVPDCSDGRHVARSIDVDELDEALRAGQAAGRFDRARQEDHS